MAKIGHIPEIIAVKNCLEKLKKKGIIEDWGLPCENLLTRLTAAVFFVEPRSEENMATVCESLKEFPDFRFAANEGKLISQLKYRIEFNKDGVEL